MRHATTAEELESLLLDGVLSAEPVAEEITAETKRPCPGHSAEPTNSPLLPVLSQKRG